MSNFGDLTGGFATGFSVYFEWFLGAARGKLMGRRAISDTAHGKKGGLLCKSPPFSYIPHSALHPPTPV
ncbi:MAG TPA: hypothetical protein VG796_09360 [Verrucomicrobiales bacterium]|nr:hypothetical protein [Verrucomicrobiales bacterium]